MNNVTDLLYRQGAYVEWMANLGWAFPDGDSSHPPDEFIDLLEGYNVEHLNDVFGIKFEEDSDLCDRVDTLLTHQKFGFIARILLSDRDNWTDEGWSVSCLSYVLYAYGDTIEELETAICKVITDRVERMKVAKFNQPKRDKVFDENET